MQQESDLGSMEAAADPLFDALPALFTIEEVAAAFGVHRNTLRRWRRRDIGPRAHRLPGGGWRYRQDEVLAWLQDCCACCGRIHTTQEAGTGTDQHAEAENPTIRRR